MTCEIVTAHSCKLKAYLNHELSACVTFDKMRRLTNLSEQNIDIPYVLIMISCVWFSQYF